MKKLLGIVVLSLLFSFNAYSENKISTKDHWQSYHGKTKAGTGEKGYSKDYEHKIEGKYSEKFVLGHGDCGWDQGYNDCKNDRGRIERVQSNHKDFGRHKWYRFSFFLDPNWDEDTTASIAQVKTEGVRYPVWMLRVDHGILKFDSNMIDQRCKYLLGLDSMAGKWTDIVLFVNYSKKKVKWMYDTYVALWINGERVDTRGCSSTPVLGKFASSWHKQGGSFRYGLYHSYVSRELNQKAMLAGKDMNLKGWNDKHTEHTSKSKTNDPWNIDWPVKLETKRIWFDNMHMVKSKKNLYEELK